jgi:hypothetical protein
MTTPIHTALWAIRTYNQATHNTAYDHTVYADLDAVIDRAKHIADTDHALIVTVHPVNPHPFLRLDRRTFTVVSTT